MGLSKDETKKEFERIGKNIINSNQVSKLSVVSYTKEEKERLEEIEEELFKYSMALIDLTDSTNEDDPEFKKALFNFNNKGETLRDERKLIEEEAKNRALKSNKKKFTPDELLEEVKKIGLNQIQDFKDLVMFQKLVKDTVTDAKDDRKFNHDFKNSVGRYTKSIEDLLEKSIVMKDDGGFLYKSEILFSHVVSNTLEYQKLLAGNNEAEKNFLIFIYDTISNDVETTNFEDEQTIQLMEGLRKVYKAPFPIDSVTDSIENPALDKLEDNLIMFHGKPIDALAKVTTKKAIKDELKKQISIFDDDFSLKIGLQDLDIPSIKSFKGTVGINTHKLLITAISQFTKNNEAHKASKDIVLKVYIPVKEYALKCGFDVVEKQMDNEEEQKKEKRRASRRLSKAKESIREDLSILDKAQFDWVETNQNLQNFQNNGGDFAIKIIGSWTVDYNNIVLFIDPGLAEYLIQTPLMYYPSALLKIDARKPTAYQLGYKMSTHYSNLNNQKIGTFDRLKVSTLLAGCGLPTIEEVKKARNSWESRIQEPFINAMEELVKVGVLESWRPCKKGGEPIPDEEISLAYPSTYEDWSDTLIQFKIKDAPDYDEMLKQRELKKGKNKKKKTTKKKTK